MAEDMRLSLPILKVLNAFVHNEGALAGTDLIKYTDTPSGTLYPILRRLEENKWLASKWETGKPQKMGRPKKRLYKLTANGRKKTLEALASVS